MAKISITEHDQACSCTGHSTTVYS